MTETDHDSAEPTTDRGLTWISYGDFGSRFFDDAVTIDRITAAIEGMAGKGIKIGPLQLGPAGLAGFVAEGNVGDPTITRHEGSEVAYDLLVPASLAVVLRLGQEIRIQVGVEIKLVLSARAARPLRIVIDIPRITHRDVKLVVRAEALGAAWQWLLEPMGEVIRREVATRLNAMLSEKDSLRGRIFDIAARINDDPKENLDLNFTWMTYEEFGTAFYQTAITQKRIEDGVADLSGRELTIGPLKAGPKNMAEVNATGNIGTPKVAKRPGDIVVFDVLIPVTLDLTIAMGRQNHYTAEIGIPLVLTARAADYLVIVVDVPAPEVDDIKIDLKAKGLGASMLGVVGNVNREIAEQVAAVVAEEVADQSGRTVDVAERIASA